MGPRQMDDLLMEHADALARGEDWTERLLAGNPAHQAQLQPLLSLARLLRNALVPVDPPADFVAALAAELASFDAAEDGDLHPARRYGVIGAATVGSLISVAGVTYWLYRRLGTREQALPAAG